MLPLRDDKSGYDQLIDLHSKISSTHFNQIDIDMQQVDWFDANMCAVMGAILHRSAYKDNNTSRLVNTQPQIKEWVC